MNKALLYTLRWYLKNWNDESKCAALKIISSLLGETPRETEFAIANPAIKTDPVSISPALSGPKAKVALVIGHNSKNRGAEIKGSINQEEWDFNNEVSEIMLAKAWGGLEMRRFHRKYTGAYSSEIREVYSRVNDWNPDLAIEMHFNGYNGRTGYSFMLHHHRSEISKRCAAAMNRVFVLRTGFDDKRTKALTGKDRGYLSTAACRAPMVLTEPFFGDYPGHVEKVSELGHTGIAEIYLDAVKLALNEL